jgi:hypothetical protein
MKVSKRSSNIQEFCAVHGACNDGRQRAMANCADMAEAWRTLKPEWLVWVATRPGVLDDKTLRLFACWCVRQVWHLLTDERSRAAVEVAERFARDDATNEELIAASAAARDAAYAAASDAARDAAYAAARTAARIAAAYAAARTAARIAARIAAAYAAARIAARIAANAAARTAASAAARAAQAEWLRASCQCPFYQSRNTNVAGKERER